MQILVLSSRVPWPLDKGDKLRLYHQLRYLAQIADIHLICLDDKGIDETAKNLLEGICQKVDFIPHRWWDKILGLFLSLFSGLPFSVGFFYSPLIKASIQSKTKDAHYDALYLQLVRMGPYRKGFNVPIYIDFMDCFTLSYKLRAQWSKNWFQKLFFQIECRRMNRYESKLSMDCRRSSSISARDARCIGYEIDHSDHVVIPNGVDTVYFSKNEFKSIEKTHDLVFVGNLGYFPNIQAVQFIYEQIWPLLSEKGFKNLKVLIAGSRPDQRVLKYISESFEVMADPPDIRLAYLRGKIFVAPLFCGAGQQNKILEAMSLEIPCITTTHVNASIGALPDREILLADRTEDFVRLIADLIENPGKAEDLAAQAYSMVQKNFSWKSSNQGLMKLFDLPE